MLLPLTQTVERLRAKERTPFLPPEKGKDPKNPHRWRCPLVKDEDKIREELGRVARSKPRSGRGQQAKVTALRTLSASTSNRGRNRRPARRIGIRSRGQ